MDFDGDGEVNQSEFTQFATGSGKAQVQTEELPGEQEHAQESLDQKVQRAAWQVTTKLVAEHQNAKNNLSASLVCAIAMWRGLQHYLLLSFQEGNALLDPKDRFAQWYAATNAAVHCMKLTFSAEIDVRPLEAEEAHTIQSQQLCNIDAKLQGLWRHAGLKEREWRVARAKQQRATAHRLCKEAGEKLDQATLLMQLMRRELGEREMAAVAVQGDPLEKYKEEGTVNAYVDGYAMRDYVILRKDKVARHHEVEQCCMLREDARHHELSEWNRYRKGRSLQTFRKWALALLDAAEFATGRGAAATQALLGGSREEARLKAMVKLAPEVRYDDTRPRGAVLVEQPPQHSVMVELSAQLPWYESLREHASMLYCPAYAGAAVHSKSAGLDGSSAGTEMLSAGEAAAVRLAWDPMWFNRSGFAMADATEEHHLLQVLAQLEEALGVSHPVTMRAAHALLVSCDASGQTDTATTLRRRLHAVSAGHRLCTTQEHGTRHAVSEQQGDLAMASVEACLAMVEEQEHQATADAQRHLAIREVSHDAASFLVTTCIVTGPEGRAAAHHRTHPGRVSKHLSGTLCCL